ncbi:MAG TPA: HlyD family secretion protein [Hyphomicrobiales bacterium]|nr:HlyD family secretion protein [Hyphomicrobiales bacterium]
MSEQVSETAAGAAEPEAAPNAPVDKASKRKLRILALALVVAGIAAAAWWHYQARYPSTEDAYLQANIVRIGARVGGTILDVAATDHQRVARGDLLFRIDPAPYEANVRQAEAALEQALQAAGASGAEVEAARAGVEKARAGFVNTERAYGRTAKLRKTGDVAEAALDKARSDLDQAKAAVAAAEADLQRAEAALGAGGAANAGARAAAAALDRARLDLDDTRVVAPADGWLATVAIRPGQTIGAGAALFALVEDGEWWVEANFKETDLGRIRPGQPATIEVDAYPDLELAGTVESIGPGSGAVFSMLPPENATGNWVKVTQRFTVRVRIDNPPTEARHQLRVGASSVVRVDTTVEGNAEATGKAGGAS